MRTLLRLISLWWQACALRLDQLLPDKTPILIRLLFLPAMCFGAAKHNRAESLRIFLERQGPIFVKFGQLLSTRPDLLADDIAEELNRLQDRVAPFPNVEALRIIESSLGNTVGELFARYDEAPLASASLAQVHSARLHSGEEVVIKVVRPGVDKQIRRDIRVMKTLATLLNQLGADGRRLRAPEVVEDYEFNIENELSMPHEAANAQRLRDNFIDNPINYTPKVYWDYLRDNVMVSERIDGIPVTDRAAMEAHGIDIKQLAELGVGIFFTQLFEHNFFHADMHPGNIFVSKTVIDPPQYISIDCAIVGSLTNAERHALASMLLAVFRRDYRKVAEVQINAGWVGADTPVHKFEAEIRTVCEPIFAKPLSEISFATMLVTLFKTARRFDMQVMPSLVLLEKTIVNIEGLGRQLYPDLDLWATAQPYLEKWSKDRYSPKAILKQLRQQAPDWLERAPELPPLLYNLLLDAQPTPKLAEKQCESRWQTHLPFAVAMGAGLGAYVAISHQQPDWSELCVTALAIVGIYALVRQALSLR